MVVLGGEADSAEHLERALADPAAVAAREGLDDLAEHRRCRVVKADRLVEHGFDGDAVGAGPGEEMADGLKRADRIPELRAVGGIVGSEFDGALGGTKDLCCDRDSC